MIYDLVQGALAGLTFAFFSLFTKRFWMMAWPVVAGLYAILIFSYLLRR